MSSVKKASICALCVALCSVLPLAFHAVGLGAAFSPLHLPVLLCGLICGWPYGVFCGVAGPVISSFFGMPSVAQLSYMIPELCVYGLISGLLMSGLRTGRLYPDLYLSLIPAMVLGRLAGAGAEALAARLLSLPDRSLPALAAAYFGSTLPGAALQLIVIPALVLALTKARLIPARYPENNARKLHESKA